VVSGTTSQSQVEPNLDLVWQRLHDQDRRIRELEASDVALRDIMVTKTQLVDSETMLCLQAKKQIVDSEAALRLRFDSNLQDLKTETTRVEHKVNTCAEQDVRSILKRLVELGEQVDHVGEQLEGEDSIFRIDLRAAERRWQDELAQQETRLEGKMDEQEVKWQDMMREQVFKMEQMDSRVNDALAKLKEDFFKAPWQRQVEEDDFVRRKELEEALRIRPTMTDINGYTNLVTTQAIVNQLSDLHLRADKQFNGLQGGLNTLERLYLRQLDKSAEMVYFYFLICSNSLIQS
jgi:hypothetical protein